MISLSTLEDDAIIYLEDPRELTLKNIGNIKEYYKTLMWKISTHKLIYIMYNILEEII